MTKYVGISANRLKDRWRLSPSYDSNLSPLKKRELFHSQCWPKICAEHRAGNYKQHKVSVLHSAGMGAALEAVGSGIIDKNDLNTQMNIRKSFSDVESWFIKNLSDQLWNIKL